MTSYNPVHYWHHEPDNGTWLLEGFSHFLVFPGGHVTRADHLSTVTMLMQGCLTPTRDARLRPTPHTLRPSREDRSVRVWPPHWEVTTCHGGPCLPYSKSPGHRAWHIADAPDTPRE